MGIHQRIVRNHFTISGSERVIASSVLPPLVSAAHSKALNLRIQPFEIARSHSMAQSRSPAVEGATVNVLDLARAANGCTKVVAVDMDDVLSQTTQRVADCT